MELGVWSGRKRYFCRTKIQFVPIWWLYLPPKTIIGCEFKSARAAQIYITLEICARNRLGKKQLFIQRGTPLSSAEGGKWSNNLCLQVNFSASQEQTAGYKSAPMRPLMPLMHTTIFPDNSSEYFQFLIPIVHYARETLCCFLGNSLHFITQLTPRTTSQFMWHKEKRELILHTNVKGGGISVNLFFTPSPLVGGSPQGQDYIRS